MPVNYLANQTTSPTEFFLNLIKTPTKTLKHIFLNSFYFYFLYLKTSQPGYILDKKQIKITNKKPPISIQQIENVDKLWII